MKELFGHENVATFRADTGAAPLKPCDGVRVCLHDLAFRADTGAAPLKPLEADQDLDLDLPPSAPTPARPR